MYLKNILRGVVKKGIFDKRYKGLKRVYKDLLYKEKNRYMVIVFATFKFKDAIIFLKIINQILISNKLGKHYL